RIPTPMPVCTQKIRLSISPGISPPIRFSNTGVNQGSYSVPVTSFTIWLPASSLPPNSAPLKARKGTTTSRILTRISTHTSPLFDFLCSAIRLLLSEKSDRPKFRSRKAFHPDHDQHRQDSLQHCQRQLRRGKYTQKLHSACCHSARLAWIGKRQLDAGDAVGQKISQKSSRKDHCLPVPSKPDAKLIDPETKKRSCNRHAESVGSQRGEPS